MADRWMTTAKRDDLRFVRPAYVSPSVFPTSECVAAVGLLVHLGLMNWFPLGVLEAHDFYFGRGRISPFSSRLRRMPRTVRNKFPCASPTLHGLPLAIQQNIWSARACLRRCKYKYSTVSTKSCEPNVFEISSGMQCGMLSFFCHKK